jgi:hypothetical protein
LASNSKYIATLNKGVIPPHVVTGQIRYGAVPLGLFATKVITNNAAVEYDIFSSERNGRSVDSDDFGGQLSVAATNLILGVGNNANLPAYMGDGIAHLDSQSYGAKFDLVDNQLEVLHTDEPSKFVDINTMICRMGFKWIPSCPK